MTTTDDRQQQVTFPGGWFTHEQYTTDEGRALSVAEIGEYVGGTTAKVVVRTDHLPRIPSMWLEVGHARNLAVDIVGSSGTLHLTIEHAGTAEIRHTYVVLPGISPEGLIAALQRAIAERRQ